MNMIKAMTPEQLITDNLDIWTQAIRPKSSAGRGNGNNGKYELYGIKKLRELVLELAVRGLLVPQDPNDEPASELLKKISAEKSKLISEGKIKKQKTLPPITAIDKPYNIPESWVWEHFGSLAQHNAGKTLDKGRNKGQLRKYLTTSNLYWGNFDLTEVRQMPMLDADIEKCQATKGDLLICEGGEAGRAAVWEEDYDICFQNHVHRARFYGGISPHFAFRLMQKLDHTGEINQFRKGVAISNMSGKALASIPFPLPPLAEQHRIVAKVDELMALCDQLEKQTEASLAAHQTLVETLLNTLTNAPDNTAFKAAWQRIAEHFDSLFTTEHSIDQLKQTILQLAVMGKLVPQDPNDEPASELLKKIAAEKVKLIKEGKIKKQKPLPAITDDEKPFELPLGWEWTYLNDLNALVTDGDHQAPPKSDTGVPFLVIGNLNKGIVDFSNCKYVRKDYYKSLDWGKKPNQGDLLYTVTGSYGIPVAIESSQPFCVQRHVAILKAVTATPSKYLYFSLSSRMAYTYATSIATGIAQKTVPLSGLRKMLIPLPPLSEQLRIVNKIEELMILCEQFKVQLANAQTTQLNLADTITKQILN